MNRIRLRLLLSQIVGVLAKNEFLKVLLLSVGIVTMAAMIVSTVSTPKLLVRPRRVSVSVKAQAMSHAYTG
jgi:hypothetical protein